MQTSKPPSSSFSNGIESLSRQETKDVLFQATIVDNPWLRQKPTKKQEQFLKLDCLEALYGGAAGGAKFSCLLMAALQYVDCPGYNAIILRRTYRDLALSGALMDWSKEWLAYLHIGCDASLVDRSVVDGLFFRP